MLLKRVDTTRELINALVGLLRGTGGRLGSAINLRHP
jgi:hypothetical protein